MDTSATRSERAVSLGPCAGFVPNREGVVRVRKEVEVVQTCRQSRIHTVKQTTARLLRAGHGGVACTTELSASGKALGQGAVVMHAGQHSCVGQKNRAR